MGIHSKRSLLFRLTWPVTHYFVMMLSAFLSAVFFNVFSRTTVIGRKNVPQKPGTLLISNHQTMMDSFLVGSCAFFPISFIKPWLIPWNPAAQENFYRNPLQAWLADNWKCIPIKAGRKDLRAIFKMTEALKHGPLLLFSEGTRSRSGEIGRGRAGSGFLILSARPTVIPVCVDGMEKVLPIGSVFPRLFQHVYVAYGKPLDLSAFEGKPRNKDTAQEAIDMVIDAVRELQREIRRRRGEK